MESRLTALPPRATHVAYKLLRRFKPEESSSCQVPGRLDPFGAGRVYRCYDACPSEAAARGGLPSEFGGREDRAIVA